MSKCCLYFRSDNCESLEFMIVDGRRGLLATGTGILLPFRNVCASWNWHSVIPKRNDVGSVQKLHKKSTYNKFSYKYNSLCIQIKFETFLTRSTVGFARYCTYQNSYRYVFWGVGTDSKNMSKVRVLKKTCTYVQRRRST
jgi:hypothetical protein